MIDTKELYRKAIHFSSIYIPCGFIYLEKQIFFPTLLVIAVIVLAVDIGRQYSAKLAAIFDHIFGQVLREHETKKLTGASFMMISAVLVYGLCSVPVAVLAMSVLIICDSVAALVGKKYGKTLILNKSLEGFAGFVFSGIIIIYAMAYLNLVPSRHFITSSGVAVIIAGIIELISAKLKMDDNLSIPLAIAVVMAVLE